MKIIIRDYSIILIFIIIIKSNLLARLSLTHACVKYVSFVFLAAMTKVLMNIKRNAWKL